MQERKAEYSILPVILNRRSSRAMTGEDLSDTELMTLFEAARWAQSSYNNQPWRFVYAKKGTPYWNNLLDLLVPANKVWAKNAAVLIMVISHTLFEYNSKPSRTHTFDAGAALQNLALQGTSMGLVVHGMEGFDYEKARMVAEVPADYAVEALFAVGRHGNIDQLPQALQAREIPTDRKPLTDLVFEGMFPKKED